MGIAKHISKILQEQRCLKAEELKGFRAVSFQATEEGEDIYKGK